MTLTADRFFSLTPAQCSPDVEARFFSHLKMRNSTFKKTEPSRFTEIEEKIGDYFRQRAQAIGNVLDVGVSSGLTTIELADFLATAGARAAIVATDLFVDASVIQVAPGVRVLADSQGWPLQYDVGGVPIRAWSRRLDYFTFAWLPMVAARRLAMRRAKAALAQGEGKRVALVSPRLGERKNISFIENDIMASTPELTGRFDVVRAANVLNSNYFSENQLRQALTNIRSYMRAPGSLLLVTRTDGSKQNSGTLFALGKDGSFEVLERVRGGSEIESLIVERKS